MRLTKRKIDAAEFDDSAPSFQVIWDDRLPGFGVRLYKSGTKSFVIRYRNEQGRKRYLTLGKFGVLTLQQARDLAREKFVEVNIGDDPAADRQKARTAATVNELGDAYLEKHAKPHKKTWKKDESRLKRHIKPAWGSRKPAEITHSDVATLHRSIGKESPYEANRTLALIQTVFNFAIDEGIVPRDVPNPASNVKKYDEKKRERWIKHEEMPAFLSAIAQESDPYMRAVFWMLLLTGARKTEILQTRWKDVDLKRAELFIPDTKNGTDHTVPLSKPALEVLRDLEQQKGNPFVFCGHRKGRPLVNISKAWTRICERAKLDDVRIHDLRRTAASWLAISGYSMLVIKKLLNHSVQGVTGIYARMSPEAVRKAVEDLGQQVIRAAHEEEADVIPIAFAKQS